MNLLPYLLELQAKDAAKSDHQHHWEHRPHQSCDSVTRYQCSICQRWGNRRWGTCGRTIPPIVAYSRSSAVPPPEWGTDDAHQVALPEQRPHRWDDADGFENPKEWTPPARWRNHL